MYAKMFLPWWQWPIPLRCSGWNSVEFQVALVVVLLALAAAVAAAGGRWQPPSPVGNCSLRLLQHLGQKHTLSVGRITPRTLIKLSLSVWETLFKNACLGHLQIHSVRLKFTFLFSGRRRASEGVGQPTEHILVVLRTSKKATLVRRCFISEFKRHNCQKMRPLKFIKSGRKCDWRLKRKNQSWSYTSCHSLEL